MGKQWLEDAKARKNDEFYTLRADVEKEVEKFSENFLGKTVICPCNDGDSSAFTQFFSENFEKLQLKAAIFVEFGGAAAKGRVKFLGKNWEELEGNGDFRSEEIKALIESADVVCTNPPFSLLRPFVLQLVEMGKEFLIVAPELSITSKEVAPLFIKGELDFGYTKPSDFRTPDGTLKCLRNVMWLTNFAVEREPWPCADIDVESFEVYDNLAAREIPKCKQIPKNTKGELLGVPVTFAKHLDRRQFEVVGVSECDSSLPAVYVGGRKKFRRLFVRKKQ